MSLGSYAVSPRHSHSFAAYGLALLPLYLGIAHANAVAVVEPQLGPILSVAGNLGVDVTPNTGISVGAGATAALGADMAPLLGGLLPSKRIAAMRDVLLTLL